MKKCLTLFLLLFLTGAAFACSTFLLQRGGQLVFGRNYDWVSGTGILAVNARGVNKASLVPPGEKTLAWSAAFGSITFNQFGKEFPHGGINEAGLVIEIMWLPGTAYPQPDHRPALNELQWIQYQLDNFSSVAEVISSAKTVRIGRDGAAPLHYLVADASGKAATIEFIGGRMVVHQGADPPFAALTNTIYSEALQATRRGTKPNATGDHSIDRFATVCSMVKQFQAAPAGSNAVDYAFSILDKVAMGNYTRWRIVYDIANREIAFVTAGSRKTVRMAAFDFSCPQNTLYLDINTKAAGNVRNLFAPLSTAENEKRIRLAAKESRSQILIPEETIRGAAAWYGQMPCEK